MNSDSFFEEMMRDDQQEERFNDAKVIFDEILARVPNFKQAIFLFEAKDGVFGPVSFRSESLRQDADMEVGWFLDKERNLYEFCGDSDESIESDWEEVSSYDVGSAVAEILNNNNEALVRLLFGDSKVAFSNGNALTRGTLEVSIVPQDSSVELQEDDSGQTCRLSEDFRGLRASFTSSIQVPNAVMVYR